ncbi:MAG TPA: RNase adapter RapZ [Gammaproteobacteria bacterium]|nr:RNase adapter RapZ [Gammaproteobacteria bacterium]
MRLVILSGLSGSGKSVALHMLEDLGYYCVDNIPAGHLQSFVRETLLTGDPAYDRMAVGIDARNRIEDIRAVPQTVKKLKADGIECEIVFLYAEDAVLLKRYSESHRPHPLAGDGRALKDAIAAERELLAPLADEADMVLDSSRTSVHELRELVRERIHREDRIALSLLFQSFGFRHGIPGDSDFVFDARGLPNPYWEPSLRNLSGKDSAVMKYLERQELVQHFVTDIQGLLDFWIPKFESSNRQYLTISVGCTGGYHRSVYVVERLTEHFKQQGREVLTRHNGLK